MSLPLAASPLQLQADTETATAGYFQLSWQDPAGTISEYVLQNAETENFASSNIVYQGVDTATVITGQKDGIYFFRVGKVQTNGEINSWSKTLKITVDHHPLSRAVLFFVTGAVVFVATLAAILLGNRKYPKQ